MQTEQQLIAEQAAQWVVKLSTGQCSAEDLVALQQWQQQSPAHAEAFGQLQQLIDRLQSLQQHNIGSEHPIIQQQVLKKKSRVAKYASSSFLLLLLAVAIPALPWRAWTADVQNSQQVWQQQHLSDSSVIAISGKTAYNIRYSKQQRLIQLIQGNILVDVAKDAKRPFVVETQNARIQALGTSSMQILR
jgi:transmembrane sensor